MRISNRTIILFLTLTLTLAAALYAGLWLTRPQGAKVLVTVDGHEFGIYDLHRNQTVVICPENGRWHNTLVIQDGRAEISESDCDNQICVHTPPLTEDTIGIIVCLPHGVAVELIEPN